MVGGLLVTLSLAGASLAIALVEGILLGVIASEVSFFERIVRGGFWVTSSLPLIIALYWAHYPLQEALAVVWSPFWVAVAVLSQIATFFIGNSVLHAISSLPRQLVELAVSASLSKATAIRRIYTPIIWSRVLPDFLSASLWILHGTLFASLISVPESFRVAQQINSVVHAPIPVYTALAGIFASVSLPIFALTEFLRRRLSQEGMLY
jgi:polar amino acid transport system permease protein